MAYSTMGYDGSTGVPECSILAVDKLSARHEYYPQILTGTYCFAIPCPMLLFTNRISLQYQIMQQTMHQITNDENNNSMKLAYIFDENIEHLFHIIFKFESSIFNTSTHLSHYHKLFSLKFQVGYAFCLT